ncbi:hypothetical protein K1T71_013903 [Dendrolimus kikuchii]|uniref:Uncharacterized protein n=1 Tax=Dendrolimus kikuchii TaxID=765133 RepID=A0ACC1CGC6_9NEOP|nr:hypothetical protein K1T71_013903 [Dendrolimus kikuchii]
MFSSTIKFEFITNSILFKFITLDYITCQIPKHMDLLYLGDVSLQNKEKYKVLRPVAHEMTDYFKEYMLRTISSVPGEKLYMDENGFRHKWKFVEENSSRKSADRSNIEKDYSKVQTYKTGVKIVESDVIKNQTNTNNVSLAPNRIKNDYNSSFITAKKKYRPKRKKKDLDESHATVEEPKADLRQAIERTMVKTSFFCPFFGVITMHSYLD